MCCAPRLTPAATTATHTYAAVLAGIHNCVDTLTIVRAT